MINLSVWSLTSRIWLSYKVGVAAQKFFAALSGTAGSLWGERGGGQRGGRGFLISVYGVNP
jgi:hypothetical protein